MCLNSNLVVFQFFAFTAMAICGYDGYLQVLEYRARRANAETARHPGQFDTSIPDQFGTSSIGQPGYRPTDPTGYGDTQPGVVRTTTTTVVTEYVAADRSVTSPPAYSADPSKLMYWNGSIIEVHGNHSWFIVDAQC